MPAEGQHGRTVGVDRLEPGDHAFLAYTADEHRWDILGVFAQEGLARGEKVSLLVDVAYSPAEVAARVTGDTAAACRAIATGQLVVSKTPRFSRGGFDARRLVEGTRRRIGTAAAEGFSGLRSASEMSLALAPVDHLDQAVDCEHSLHESLFAGQRNRAYTALCCWDERVFGGTAAMAAARAVHPVTVLSRPGALHATLTSGGAIITGDIDVANRAELDAVLRKLAGLPQAKLTLDMTDLSFLEAHGAGAVLRLAAGLDPQRHLEVRCRSAHRRMLHLLGARSIRQLTVITDRL